MVGEALELAVGGVVVIAPGVPFNIVSGLGDSPESKNPGPPAR